MYVYQIILRSDPKISTAKKLLRLIGLYLDWIDVFSSAMLNVYYQSLTIIHRLCAH